MKNKLLAIIILVLAAGAAASFFIKNRDNGMVLFYGDGCPFCAKVDAFIAENNIEEKISFTRKEVYNNKSNVAELAKRASDCGILSDNIRIPFLWNGSQCLVGDVDIINFFKQKAGI